MITSHVLDIANGTPAVGVAVILEIRGTDDWRPLGRGTSDERGRVTLVDSRPLDPGTYRLTFDLGDYHRAHGVAAPFFPEAKVIFSVRDPSQHYHVPLVISPFGYSTYRGA